MSLLDANRQVTVDPRTGRKTIQLAPRGSVLAAELARQARPVQLPPDWRSTPAVARLADLPPAEIERRAAERRKRVAEEKATWRRQNPP